MNNNNRRSKKTNPNYKSRKKNKSKNSKQKKANKSSKPLKTPKIMSKNLTINSKNIKSLLPSKETLMK